MDSAYRGIVVSTFNAALLAKYLENDETAQPSVSVIAAPFGQVHSYLLGAAPARADEFLILWTQPEAIVGSFQRMLHGGRAGLDALYAEVDDFARLIHSIKDRYAHIFIPTWVVPTYNRCLGAADLRNGIGVRNSLWRMNLRLCDQFESDPHIHMLDTQRWIEQTGSDAFDSKLWYMGKIPFSPPLFALAAADCKAALRAAYGLSKKLLIVDLDDTLWGGIVGDDGWENLRLGGHDPIGEAYRDFQTGLKALKQRGILLGIVSKNDEQTALTAIKRHPEMVLREDDFAGWKINWNDKAENVRQLAAELRLGLQSVVFIDDNPVERARVAEALPEVEVPEWPADAMLSARTLLSLPFFDSAAALTAEDAARTELYLSERRRENAKLASANAEEWLAGLQMKVTVSELTPANLPRAVQLFNKTNQMNLATRRMSERELLQWLEAGTRKLWAFAVTDRFGDSGLTGITSVEICGNRAEIVDFLLSCRVMGRSIENFMIATAVAFAHTHGCERLTARLVPTEKNGPCRDFWRERSGFAPAESGEQFDFDPRCAYASPQHIFCDSAW